MMDTLLAPDILLLQTIEHLSLLAVTLSIQISHKYITLPPLIIIASDKV